MPDTMLAPAARTVEATLNYLRPGIERPRRYVDEPPPGEPRSTIESDPRRVVIEDARVREAEFTLDRNGFALLAAPTRVADLRDEAALHGAYRPEVEALLREALGATRVIAFDHTLRSPPRPGQPLREPVQRVHNDYTARSAAQRVRDLLPPEEAGHVLEHRFAIVNLWRPVAAPVLRDPLALADAATVGDAELVPTGLIYADREGETVSVRFAPTHRWYYFSALRRDEAILIKCHDSATDGRAKLSAHTAFADPTTPADAPPRESVEVRTIVSWAPAG